MTDEHLSKRARTEDDEDDEAALLDLEYVDGDNFITEEQRQEAEAQRKRELRRQRLAQLPSTENEEHVIANKHNRSIQSAVMEVDTAENSMMDIAPSTAIDYQDQTDRVKRGDKSEEKSNDNEDDDEFDMFSSSVSPVQREARQLSGAETRQGHEQADWDDSEGYYKAVIGEVITIEPSISSSSNENATTNGTSIILRVTGVIGKGVFSTVLKCSTMSNSSSVELPPVVALKCVRHNDSMAKAAVKELQMLLRLKGAPGTVPLLLPTTQAPIEYRGHVLLVFSFVEYNLRDVLQKFGKGVGLSLQAVRSYCGQLLAGLTQLKKHNIIHCDLKPDNILVSADFGVCQIADFGSAVEANSGDNMPTPYLVSRFYRAPEIILGLQPTFAVDLWSIAVTVVELYLGDVLFRGQTNNEMVYLFMQFMGAVPNRVIRQHLAQAQRLPNVSRQFQPEGPAYSFIQHVVDPVSHKNVVKLRPLSGNADQTDIKFPHGTPLHQRILKARSANDRKSQLQLFSDLLQKCLTLDPTRRIELRDALRHDFFATAATTTATTEKQNGTS